MQTILNANTAPWRVCGLVLVASTATASNPSNDDAAGIKVERIAPVAPATQAAGDHWVTIIGPEGPLGVAGLGRNLVECGDVRLGEDDNRLVTEPGAGVVAAVKKFWYGDDNNLKSSEHFGDCEVSLEFMLGKNANSGVKLQERYEIQLYDSRDNKELSGADCGGVYPHWVPATQGIKYTDEGFAPLRNAAKGPGEWQTLRIVFKAPRFSDKGEKIENARFVSVLLNGEIVQQDVDIDSPTGNTDNPLPEVATAPLYLQMDHGAVAFRQVRVRPL